MHLLAWAKLLHLAIHLGVYQVKQLRPFINYTSRCIADSETRLRCIFPNLFRSKKKVDENRKSCLNSRKLLESKIESIIIFFRTLYASINRLIFCFLI